MPRHSMDMLFIFPLLKGWEWNSLSEGLLELALLLPPSLLCERPASSSMPSRPSVVAVPDAARVCRDSAATSSRSFATSYVACFSCAWISLPTAMPSPAYFEASKCLIILLFPLERQLQLLCIICELRLRHLALSDQLPPSP